MNVTVPYTALDFAVVLRKVGHFEIDNLKISGWNSKNFLRKFLIFS
jgi:hypothetical protein